MSRAVDLFLVSCKPYVPQSCNSCYLWPEQPPGLQPGPRVDFTTFILAQKAAGDKVSLCWHWLLLLWRGSRRGRAFLAKAPGSLPCPGGLDAPGEHLKGGVKHRESVGMEWVGDHLVSPPPTSLAGWELPSRLVALSISYKNVLVIYWFWWQALAGVAMPCSELAKLNHTAQLGGVATVTFSSSSTHPTGQKFQFAALQREEVLRNTAKTKKTTTIAKSLDIQLTQHPAVCVCSL